MFALDTNTVSYLLRGQGRVASRLMTTDPADIAIPAVVAHELRYGLLRMGPAGAARRDDLEAFLACLRILPLDAPAATEAAAIRFELEVRGQPIGPFDVLIAGIARSQHAVLVTHNSREFEKVPGLEVVDWY